jgi:hypothetical protein
MHLDLPRNNNPRRSTPHVRIPRNK